MSKLEELLEEARENYQNTIKKHNKESDRYKAEKIWSLAMYYAGQKNTLEQLLEEE